MNIHALYTLRAALVAVALTGLCVQNLHAAPDHGGPDSRTKQSDSRSTQRGGGDSRNNDSRNNDSRKQSPVVVKPAPVVVKPAPVVVKPAPVVVKPAPVIVKTAPVVVTVAPEQRTADDYLKLLAELPRISDDVAAGRMSLNDGVVNLMKAAQAIRVINEQIGRGDEFSLRLRALLSTATYDSSIQNLRNTSAACNEELAKTGYFSSPTYQGAVAEYLSAMFNAG